MNAQKKFYIILAVFLAVVSVWLYYYYLPTLEVINDNKTKLLTFNTKIKSASDASNNIQKMEKTIVKLKTELTNLEQKIVDKAQLENFAKLMESEAQKYGQNKLPERM